MTRRYAGVVSRTLALLGDVVVLALLVAVTNWVIQQIGRQILAGSFLEPGRCPEGTEWWRLRTHLCRALPWALPVVGFVLPPLYRIGFWSVTGQTPGMALFGIRMLRVDGRPVGVFTALRRFLGDIACAFTLGIGFLGVLVSARRQGLQDRIGGTVVVHAWLERPERGALVSPTVQLEP